MHKGFWVYVLALMAIVTIATLYGTSKGTASSSTYTEVTGVIESLKLQRVKGFISSSVHTVVTISGTEYDVTGFEDQLSEGEYIKMVIDKGDAIEIIKKR